MKTDKSKKELSYFRLKLESYMSEHHPERLGDKEFITARADIALTAYCDAVAQGFNHLEAERIASEVLFSDCISQSTIPLFLSWRTSLRGNFLHRSPRGFRFYCWRTRLFKPHSLGMN